MCFVPCTRSSNMQKLGLEATQFDSGFFRFVLFVTTRIPVLCKNITGILVLPLRQRMILKLKLI